MSQNAGQNWVSNSYDIADIEFVWVGGCAKSFSCQTQLLLCKVELWLSWGFVICKPQQIVGLMSHLQKFISMH